MATSLGQLTDRVRYLLRSYTGQHEVTTHLTGAVAIGDLTAVVNDGNAVSTGLIEVDSEMIWVDSSSGGSVTIPPYGRGYMGTVAAAHLSGAQVLSDPLFPRKTVTDALIDTQRAIYPTLWATKTIEFTYTPAISTYNLAADTDRVLSVSWQLPGVSGFWSPMRRWRTELNANVTAFPSTNSITVFDPVAAGRTVRVVYAAPFTELALDADTIEAAGHGSSQADLLAYGACWRLIGFMDVARLNIGSVENAERAKFAPAGAASALARQIKAIFEQRLAAERDRLRQQTPISIRYSR